MKNLFIDSPVLLALFLIYFGCRGVEKSASSYELRVSKEEQLEGLWIIDSLNLPSVTVPSFCLQIGVGTAFEFTKNDSLKLYEKKVSKPCEVFYYKAQEDLINLVKGDMIMLVEYKLITNKRLVLRSKSFFKWQGDTVTDSSAYQTLLDEGVTVFLSRK